jgi:hypothetical protein
MQDDAGEDGQQVGEAGRDISSTPSGVVEILEGQDQERCGALIGSDQERGGALMPLEVVYYRWENEKKHSRLAVRRRTTKTRIT